MGTFGRKGLASAISAVFLFSTLLVAQAPRVAAATPSLFPLAVELDTQARDSAWQPKLSGGLSTAILPKADTAAMGEAVVADLLLVAGQDASTYAVTIKTTGPIKLVGDNKLTLPGLKAGQEVRVPVELVVQNEGKGSVELRAEANDAQGKQTGWSSSNVYWSAVDELVEFGSSQYALDLNHLGRKVKEGKLTKREFDNELKKKQGAGVSTAISISGAAVTPMAVSSSVIVTGQVKYLHNTQGLVPAHHVKVVVYDEDATGDDPEGNGDDRLGEGWADGNGRYSITVTNDGSTWENGVDIYVKAYAQVEGAFVEPGGVNTGGDITYAMKSQVAPNVSAPGLALDISATTQTDVDQNAAFSVSSALWMAADYVRQKHGSVLPDLEVNFPKAPLVCPSASCYDRILVDLNILQLDRWDWDVLHHEYGHYVQDLFDFDDPPLALSHSGTQNLGEIHGKSAGIRMAWAEGWPTYFGTVLQQYTSTPGGLQITYVGDSNYDDHEDGSSSYSLETQGGQPSLGEDNEYSVQRTLWDLYDATSDSSDEDVLSYDDDVLWSIFAWSKPKTLSAFFQSVTSGKPVSERANIGAIFAKHKVSPFSHLAVDNTNQDRHSIPTFDFDANGGGPTYRNNYFRIAFYDQNWNLLLEPLQFTADVFTPTAAQWETLMAANATRIYWVVEGRQEPADPSVPYTGPYYSASRSFYPMTGLDVSQSTLNMNVGGTINLTATARYGLSNTTNVTSYTRTEWISSNTNVVTVTGGTVRAVGVGTTTITVRYGGYSQTVNVTASAPMTGLSISPTNPTLSVGAGQQMTAMALYSGAPSIDVTSSTNWSSTNTAVATISQSGYVSAVAPGTTTIQASKNGFNASTTLTVSCTAGSAFGCAITLSGSTSGSVSQGQSIYYQFYASANTAYRVTLTPSSGDPDLYVHNPSQGSIGSSTSGSGADVVNFTATTSGYHYIRVYGFSAAGFTLSATTGSTGCTTGSSFDCPYTISGAGSGNVNSGQEIYYQFYAYTGSTYSVTLTPSTGDPDLYVFNPGRGQIGSSGLGAGSTDTVTFTASVTGYHYIKVLGYSAASYTINPNGSGGGGGCSTGSSFNCPYTLYSSTSGSVGQGQNVYYQFHANAGSTYTVSLAPGSGDPDLYVYNPSQSQIGQSTSGSGTDQVTFTATMSGYYYVRVYGYSSASYTLSK